MEADALTLEGILWRLALALLLVLANAFFVAAEFALVGARRTRIDALAEQGSRRARMARTAIQNLDHYISGTQLGITLASLGLGWVGETTIAEIIRQAFDGLAAAAVERRRDTRRGRHRRVRPHHVHAHRAG